MRRVSFLVLVCLTAAATLMVAHLTIPAAAQDAAQADRPRPVWEYKVVPIAGLGAPKDWESACNKLGEDGWELTATLSGRTTASAAFVRGSTVFPPAYLLFKRHKR